MNHLNDVLVAATPPCIFRIDAENEDFRLWKLTSISGEYLPGDDGFFMLSAFLILETGEVENCFIDLSLPERINDYVYRRNNGSIERTTVRDTSAEVVCGVPVDNFGSYEIFYSRRRPDIGIGVLHHGLQVSPRKHVIAEDLGYILRDEKRYPEAASAFQTSVDEGPSSYFIIRELSECYARMGNPEAAAVYQQRAADAEAKSVKRQQTESAYLRTPWWKQRPW